MWFFNILKLVHGSHLPNSANQLGSTLIEDIPVEEYDLVIGESINPDYRSPTVAQWSLGLTGRSVPAFDISCGFLTLAFLCSYLFHPNSKLNRVLYLAVHPVKSADQSPFDPAGAVVEFRKDVGKFLVLNSLTKYTELEGCLEGEIDIFEGARLQINRDHANRLAKQLPKLVDEFKLSYDKLVLPNMIIRNSSILANPIDLFAVLEEDQPGKFALVEFGLDGNLGVTVVEKIR